MAKKAYVGRYSQAIFELALERKELDKWQADLQKIVALSKEPVLSAVLESPKIRLQDKFVVLSEQLTGVGPLALNLASLLVVRGKLGIAGEIAEDYRHRYDNYRGVEQAEVTTAIPLDDTDNKMLTERLSKVTGKKVVLKSAVDASLIGGVVARVGGKLLDGSTRSKLQALKNALSRAG